MITITEFTSQYSDQSTTLCVPVCFGYSATSRRFAIATWVNERKGRPTPRAFIQRLALALGRSFKAAQQELSREKKRGMIDYTYCEASQSYKDLRIIAPIKGKLYVTFDDLKRTQGHWVKAAYLNALAWGKTKGFHADDTLQRLKKLLNRQTITNYTENLADVCADLMASIRPAKTRNEIRKNAQQAMQKHATIKNNNHKNNGFSKTPTAAAAAEIVKSAENSAYKSLFDNEAYNSLLTYFRSLGCTRRQSRRITRIIRQGDGVRWGFRYNGYDDCPSIESVLFEFAEVISFDCELGTLSPQSVKQHLKMLEGRIVKHQTLNKQLGFL